MTQSRIAAVTHARNDDFFLGLWLRHYGEQIGYENCHILLDGSDWEPRVDLSAAVTHVVERPNRNMHRIRVDRRMARLQLELVDRLFFELGYNYIFRGDCDEFVVCEPMARTSLQEVVNEAEAVGYVYSSGIDVIHNTKHESDFNPASGLLAQRGFGLISQSYCKVNLLSKKAREQGITFNAGGHRASGNAVVMSKDYYMFHLGWADRELLRQRIAPRYQQDRNNSFAEYLDSRQAIFNVIAEHDDFADFDASMQTARAGISTVNGRPATKAQKLAKGNFRLADQFALAVQIPERFNQGLPVAPLVG